MLRQASLLASFPSVGIQASLAEFGNAPVCRTDARQVSHNFVGPACTYRAENSGGSAVPKSQVW